ncbi:MAG: transglycosylase domain-containing protein, partial [Acutalibacteraceae bacterium]
MPGRRTNDSFLDKLLGIFGITRPKKRKRVVSKRKDTKPKADVEINNGFEIPLNDNFQIVSRENDRIQEIKSQRKAEDLKRNQKVKNNKPKKKKNKKMHPVLRGLLSVFLVFVITACIVVSAALVYVFVFIDDTVDADLYNLKLEYTSILYAKDKNGKDVEIKRLHGDENRLWVDNKDIPDSVRNAFISCEDKRFREHSGTDWKRTITAAVNEVFHFHSKEGGSTITQQLVKNVTGDNEQDYARKIREIMRARYLEQHYDKDTILECYLNTIHLGNGVDGVEVASNYYFDKHVKDITLTQAACLAAITNNPSQNEPYKYPEVNKSRRNWVLDEMYNNGYITKEECEEAKTADLGLRKNPSTILSTTKTVEKEECNSYFVDAVIEDVIDGLVEEKGYTKEYASSQLYKGGYKIYTTVDLDMQEKLEEVYENENNFMKVYTKSGKKPQSAMTIMDYNGNVKAVVGGRGEKKEDRVLNRATQSPRPTGSAIKPISVYAPAIEYNVITWGSSVEDSPIEIEQDGQKVKWPKNYDGSYSNSKTPVLRALQKSLNTVPVRILQEMTIDTSYKFVTEKM